MHMADYLLSPAVGGTMIAVSAGLSAFSVKKLQDEMNDQKVPLMGVMGAFVFVTQMINFSIPGTGSSGHLGGGMLLAILLGPYAGFLAMASILLIQALIFGDGGLLAYGANVFNLGFYTCLLAYPLIFRPLTRKGFSAGRIFSASMIAAVISLQLGAFSVVIETLLSGRTELPLATFVLLMQPIHLAIGLVEGLVTAAIVTFVWRIRPEIFGRQIPAGPGEWFPMRKILLGFILATLMIGGLFSSFASSKPDGLEWSLFRLTGQEQLGTTGPVYPFFAGLQDKIAILQDYQFKSALTDSGNPSVSADSVIHMDTAAAGLIGGALTLVLIALAGLITVRLKLKRKKGSSPKS